MQAPDHAVELTGKKLVLFPRNSPPAIGAILARTTRKGRIVFLGNVLPIHDNPLRVAEEIAMLDILSGGRVVCGFVRGT